MSSEKRNLNINGSGSYPGGDFDKVSISGSGKITGDIRCEKFITSGSSKIEGNIACGELKINGSSKIMGQIDGEHMQINGSCKITEGVCGGNLVICGSGSIDGSVKVNKLEIYGSASIGKDIEAEEVWIIGGMKHHGFINAERVVIDAKSSGGHMQFNEIGASFVSINKGSEERLWHKIVGLFTMRYSKVKGNIIEADTIKLMEAEIEVLRGDIIEVGPECEIELIEYTGTLKIDETAKVGQIKKIEK